MLNIIKSIVILLEEDTDVFGEFHTDTHDNSRGVKLCIIVIILTPRLLSFVSVRNSPNTEVSSYFRTFELSDRHP
jgi:hypothetical protein